MASKAAAHESFERDDVKVGSERSFGIVFATVFALIALWPLIFGGGRIRIWALVIAVAFLAVALARPALLRPLNIGWFYVGKLLHHVVNPLVMGVIFLIGVVPTALVMRARGRDPLRLDSAKTAGTTWVERVPPGPAPDTMKNLF
jgi:Saxitoxin biosynthesis operon protein SxtJ